MTRKEYLRAKLLEIIKAISEKYPELRLCQILGNSYPLNDMYYVEDEVLLNRLIEYYHMDGKMYASKYDDGGF